MIFISLVLIACGGSSSKPDKPGRSLYDLPENSPEPPVPQHVYSNIPSQSDTMWVSESESALLGMHYNVIINEETPRAEEIIAQGSFYLVQTRYWEKVGESHILYPDSTLNMELPYSIGISQPEKELTSEFLGISSQISVFSNTIENAFGDSGEVNSIPNEFGDEHRVNIRSASGVTTVFTVWQLVNRFGFTDGEGNLLTESMLATTAKNWLAFQNRPVVRDAEVIVTTQPDFFEVRESILYWQSIEF